MKSEFRSSDPEMADGIVIQNAATRPAQRRLSSPSAFRTIATSVAMSGIPFDYGYQSQFGSSKPSAQKCVECSIDGVIIPDLPFPITKRVTNHRPRSTLHPSSCSLPRNQRSPRPRNRRPHRRLHLSGVQCATTGAQKDFDTRSKPASRDDRDMNCQSTHGRQHQQQADVRCRLRPSSGAIIGSRFTVTLLNENEMRKRLSGS